MPPVRGATPARGTPRRTPPGPRPLPDDDRGGSLSHTRRRGSDAAGSRARHQPRNVVALSHGHVYTVEDPVRGAKVWRGASSDEPQRRDEQAGERRGRKQTQNRADDDRVNTLAITGRGSNGFQRAPTENQQAQAVRDTHPESRCLGSSKTDARDVRAGLKACATGIGRPKAACAGSAGLKACATGSPGFKACATIGESRDLNRTH